MAARRPKPAPAAPAPTVKVDPTLERLWDKQSKVIADAIAGDAQAFDERWEAAAAVVEHDPPLYVIGGFKSAEAFFRDVLREATRTAYRNIRVAKFATPKQEAAHGATKIDAALSYLEAKAKKPLGKTLPVALEKLRIPVAKYGKDESVSFAAATVAQIHAATSRLLKASGKARTRTKETARPAIVDALAGDDVFADVRVTERDGRISITGVPLGAWGRFVKALRGARVMEG